ncbi:hypothetical protein H2248_011904 [Termitomyces sp. 'cryptogamus']|nr:hypothetical protein H2248_011904 [Termitomyces sp. 'cryptogamus']
MQCNRPYYISPELQRIVKKCRKLTELALRDVIPEVVTLYSDLEIFLAYNLTRLRIDSYWSSLESFPKDITKLACRIPSIEILEFNPEPCKSGPYGLDQIGDCSHFILNDLFILAKHCRKLKRLSIWVSTSESYTVPYAAIPFPDLQQLHLGRSILDDSEAEDVALFLAQLLPLFCEVTFSKMLTGYHPYGWLCVNHHLTKFRIVMGAAKLRERARWCSNVVEHFHY